MPTDSSGTRYLVVEVHQQTFAIPMRDVLAIHLLESAASVDSLPVEGAREALAAIDLGYLWGQMTQLSRPVCAVVLATQTHLCAVTVDVVRPISTVAPDGLLALPHLITQLRLPFCAAIHQSESLILILELSVLIQMVQHLSPDLVRERVYAT